ncbi:hypothetical protein [Streptomyces nanshensis]|uniref:hypothetical protein n=1 Tax=Streptomyces nanshensis TaxID=518642 RepID=UPI001FD21D5B|nr:hypothetical protein [Streptomyces nanshensis]
MTEALLTYPGHIIATLRCRTDVVLEADEQGRQFPRRVGLKTEQREGIERDFSLTASLLADHTLIVTKALSPDLAGRVIPLPGKSFGEEIAAWLNTGQEVESIASLMDRAVSEETTFEQLRDLRATVHARRLDGAPMLTPTGTVTSLGDLIDARGRAALAAQHTEAA